MWYLGEITRMDCSGVEWCVEDSPVQKINLNQCPSTSSPVLYTASTNGLSCFEYYPRIIVSYLNGQRRQVNCEGQLLRQADLYASSTELFALEMTVLVREQAFISVPVYHQ